MVILIFIRFLGADYYLYRFAEQIIHEAAEDAADVKIRYHKFSVGFWPPRIEIYDLDVLAADDERRLVGMNYVHAKLSLGALMLGRIQFKELAVDHMFVQKNHVTEFVQSWIRRSSSDPNKTVTERSQASSSSYVFSYEELFQSVVIQNGKFDRTPLVVGSYVMDATDFELTVHLKKNKQKAHVQLGGLRVQSQLYSLIDNASLLMDIRLASSEQSVSSSSLSAPDGALGGRLIIDSFELDSSQLKLSLSGQNIPSSSESFSSDSTPSISSYQGWDLSSWQMKGKVSMDVATLGLLLGTGQSYGWWWADLSTTFDFQDPSGFRLEADSLFQDAMLSGYRLYDSTLNMEATHSLLQLNELKIQEKSTHYATASGVINLAEMNFDLQLFPENISLSQIYQIVGLTHDPVQSFILADFSSAELSGSYDSGFQMDITGSHFFSQVSLLGYSDQESSSLGCALDYHLRTDEHSFQILSAQGPCVDMKMDKDDLSSPTQLADALAHSSDQLSFSGTFPYNFELESPRLDVRIEGQNMASYASLVGVDLESDQMKADVSLSGGYSDMKVHIHTSGQDVRLYGFPLGSQSDAQVDVDIADGRIVFQSLQSSLAGKKYGYEDSSSGSIEVRGGSYDLDSHQLKLDIQASDLSAQMVSQIHEVVQTMQSANQHYSLFRYRVSTHIHELSLLLRIEDLFGEAQMYGHAHLKGRDLEVGSEHWLEDYHLVTSVTPKYLELSSSVVHLTEDLSLAVKGRLESRNGEGGGINRWFHPRSPVFFEFFTLSEGSGADVGDLPVIGRALHGVQWSSQLSGRGKIQGTLAQPQGTVVLWARDTEIRGGRLGHLRLSLDLDGKEMDSTLILENQDFHLRGRYEFDSQRFDVTAQMASVNLMPFVMGSSSDPRHYLYADSHMQLSGILWDPQTVQGELQVRRIEAFMSLGSFIGDSLCCVLLKTQNPWQMNLKNNQLRAPVLPLRGVGGEGSLALDDGATLDGFRLVARGRTDLAEFAEIHKSVRSLAGVLKWQGVFEYADSEVKTLELALKMDDSSPGFVLIDGFSPPMSQLTMELRLDPHFLYLDALRARKGGGLIIGHESRLSWDGKSEDSIHLTGQRNMITTQHRIFGPVIGYVDYDLNLSAQKPWLLSGEVTVDHMSTNRPLSLWREMFSDSTQLSMAQNWGHASDDVFEMDLRVKADDSIHLRNHPLSMVLGADLRVQGGWSNPVLSGSMDIAEGHFFYNKNYTITEGNLYFRDSMNFIPTMALKAQADIQGYEVLIDVNGSLDDPKFQFSANPSQRLSGQTLTQIEIMYLMANDRLPEVGADTQQDILISQAFNLAFDTVFDRFDRDKTLGQKWIQDISIQAYASKNTQGRIRASVPINTGQEYLNVTVYVYPEEVGVRAEYELNSNVVTSFAVSELTESAGGRSLDSSSSVGMKFQFSFP